MAQTLAGTRPRAATTGSAEATDTDRTWATADTADHAPAEPSGPETGQEAQAAESTDVPATPPADLRRSGPKEGIRARATRGAEDQSRRTQPLRAH